MMDQSKLVYCVNCTEYSAPRNLCLTMVTTIMRSNATKTRLCPYYKEEESK